MKINDVTKRPFPENMIERMLYLYDEPYEDTVKGLNMNSELGRRLADEILINTLTEREQFVIQHRYKECWTLKKMGEVLSLTSERIRQIEYRALRKISQPNRWKRYCNMLKSNDNPAPIPLTGDDYIEHLDISVRSYNGLKRNGINIISDLIDMTRKDLLGLRYLGDMCVDEILDKIQDFKDGKLYKQVYDEEK